MLPQDWVGQESGRGRRELARLVFRPKRDASIWAGQGHRNASPECHELDAGNARRCRIPHKTVKPQQGIKNYATIFCDNI